MFNFRSFACCIEEVDFFWGMFFDFTKRVIDILGSILGMILFSPIFVLVPIAIKLDSPGPILYCPMRVGKDGQLFRMVKFRSMRMYAVNGKRQHAESILRRNVKLFSDYKRNSYKLPADPRITRVGRIIRKYSLDEFPQFWNVLRGQMSLVGPRAYLPDELVEQQDVYPKTRPLVRLVLRGKPGLTGPWQVSGRSTINFDHRIALDAAYIKRRSFFYDMLIVAKTFPALLSTRGAV